LLAHVHGYIINYTFLVSTSRVPEALWLHQVPEGHEETIGSEAFVDGAEKQYKRLNLVPFAPEL
jgi:hypothetical protein